MGWRSIVTIKRIKSQTGWPSGWIVKMVVSLIDRGNHEKNGAQVSGLNP